ncbi:Putative methyltransferase/GDP dissociation inhibitor, putative [Leishmania donovani]|uniref:Methyltransferase/GDP dissociation inhibitor, putative n=1 Tax=Leishmania donovani TaxID=5661 RepID=A0A3S7WTI0_LEIDO|nr:Putative methyltransferase/GDP dissociation inhibitor, putative [Leishmania donovani]
MSDAEGFADLFGGVEEVPESPLQTLFISRQALAGEGTTCAYFNPLLDRFDNVSSAATAEEDAALLRQRLVRLAPPPLVVRFRDKRHSLWGHKLWNAAKYLVKRMDERMIDVRGKSVIELGAGLGVPTLAAYKNGARLCVMTDYPDTNLLDILALNLETNCAPGDMDADVKREMEEQARQQLANGGDLDSVSADQLEAAMSTRCYVEPLLWGKKEDIAKVMQYTTGGAGYDIVILSDIIFNHVCNDDLADTLAMLLAKNPHAAGYCVFSHHRAYKQLHDFEFFDKCVRRGLQYEHLDEQDYPMMFPEDRGPESVRKPVKCYKITRRYDAAGCGLDTSLCFDVVLQGTGMVQSILSAALARNGLKVLHCDGADYYAAAMATFDHATFLQYLRQPSPSSMSSFSAPDIFINRIVDDVPEARRRRYLFDVLPMCYMARGPLLSHLVSSGIGRSLECQHVHRFLFLQHPTATGAGSAATTTAMEVPLTRASVFHNATIGLFDKRRMMRFVKDVEASVAEQLHAKAANPADDPSVANTSVAAEAAVAKAAAVFTREAQANPQVTLTELLQSKYDLSGTVLDVVSLMGMMDVLPATSSTSVACSQGAAAEPPLVRSVGMVRDLLLSTGAFDGKSPYLTMSYGASEVAQNMCRISAVWGGIFVLRRSLRGVAVDEGKETQYAVLSNGQWVPAKVIVTPEELAAANYLSYGVNDWYYDFLKEQEQGRTPLIPLPAEQSGAPVLAAAVDQTKTSDKGAAAEPATASASPEAVVRFSRVVLATKTASLFSLAAMQAAGVIEVDDARDYTAAAPIITALAREPQTRAVVWVMQQSFTSDQAPARFSASDADGGAACDPCVVHFTADAKQLSQEQLHEYVMHYYTSTAKTEKPYCVPYSDIVLAAAFTVDSREVAQRGVVPHPVELPSETRWTHPYGWEESMKLRSAYENDRKHLLHHGRTGEDATPSTVEPTPVCSAAARAADLCRSSENFHLVEVPTLLPNLVYDGHYVQEAERAYKRVLDALGLPTAATATSAAVAEGDEEAAQAYAFLKPLPH